MVTPMKAERGLLAGLLFILAILGLVAGIMYFTMTAHALPSFLPGHVASAHATYKHSKRGIAAIVAAIVFFLIGLAVLMGGRRSGSGRRRHRY
jgi:uncharacterized membrane protein